MKNTNLLATFIAVLGFMSIGAHAYNGPTRCSIRAFDGHYLSAVQGGGLTRDPVSTVATRVGANELFTLVDSRSGSSNIEYGIRTSRGFYLTAVGGGGRGFDAIHADAVRLQNWEKFRFISLGMGLYAIQTLSGNYLTAQDSGGRTNDVLHTNATRIGTWEKFRLKCGL